jgi:SSS family solute:Na+ symporter
MHFSDWILFALPALLIAWIVSYSHRFTHSVADFLSGGRCAERYLLAVASNNGAIVFVALFEMISKAGFTLNWWNYMTPIVGLVLGIYGFVSYRMRETRVLTLAQFFEVRYSKAFRVFAGILGAISGLACDGIIAAVEARFFVYFLGLPETVTFASITISSYIPLMALFLFVSGCISLCGGFVAVMLIDCIEGILSQVFFLLLIYTLLRMFSWTQITDALGTRPPGKSLFNPFDTAHIQDFNIWFVLMGIFLSTYQMGAWRNSNGNQTAPLNAHEGRMGSLLSKWRDVGKGEVILLLGICAMTFLAHPDFSSGAQHVNEQLSHISDTNMAQQMTIPVAVSYFLPTGVKDVFCMILFLEMAGGTANRSQSWASIIIQDVIVPLRKKTFSPEKHLFLLKISIMGVLLYFFLFGALFHQTQYIIMWFTVAGAIFLGGAGSVIMGGLYWKKGTNAAAWAALLIGSTLAVSGILAEQIYPKTFPLNGVQVSFIASLTSIATYIVVSLLTCRQDFDMDRMLHRGKYEVIKKLTGEETKEYKTDNLLLRAIGIDKDFSIGDRWIATSLFVWMFFWLVVFIVGTIWNLMSPWPLHVWWSYWHITAIGIPIAITVVTAVWFTWGGTRDIFRLFRRLKREKINVLDNGMVIGHRNAADLALEEKIK